MMTDRAEDFVDPVMAEAIDWVLKTKGGAVEPGDQRLLDAWLAKDEAHQKAYLKAKRVWELTGQVAPTHAATAPRQLREAGAGRGDATYRSSSRAESGWTVGGGRAAGKRRRLALCSLAFASLLAAALTIQYGHFDGASYRTDIGEIRDYVLPDGSSLTLGAQSAVKVSFDQTRRHVSLLYGTAFFNVAHDANTPFTVEAGGSKLRDIGTAFNIDVDSARLDVAVESGAVAVTFKGAQPATLSAGDRLSIDRQTHKSVVTKVPVVAMSAWRGGRLVVDNEAIGDVIQQIRRYYSGYIWLRDAELGGKRISGVYDLANPLSALKSVVEPYAGAVTEVSPLLLIVSAR